MPPLTTADVQAHAADPALAAALTAGDDVQAAARLSELLTEVRIVPINQLAAWGATTGLRARLQDISVTPAHPLRSIALTALDLLRGTMAESFDTVVYGGMLDALEQGGALNSTERAQLTAIATQPRDITPNDVAAAVRNGDGSSKL